MAQRVVHRRNEFSRDADVAAQGQSDTGFTKKYNCDQLVYFELYERIEQAIAREKQLKGWVRAKKDALIARINPELKDLSAEWEAFADKPPGSLSS
jgi:predicted GIY-YIG superfamily endonuclease